MIDYGARLKENEKAFQVQQPGAVSPIQVSIRSNAGWRSSDTLTRGLALQTEEEMCQDRSLMIGTHLGPLVPQDCCDRGLSKARDSDAYRD